MWMCVKNKTKVSWYFNIYNKLLSKITADVAFRLQSLKQTIVIHYSINTFYTSAHPKDNSCEVSLKSVSKHLFNFHDYHGNGSHFLKTSNNKYTSTHPKDNSCSITIGQQNIFFKLSWLPWKRRPFWKFQALNA